MEDGYGEGEKRVEGASYDVLMSAIKIRWQEGMERNTGEERVGSMPTESR